MEIHGINNLCIEMDKFESVGFFDSSANEHFTVIAKSHTRKCS